MRRLLSIGGMVMILLMTILTVRHVLAWKEPPERIFPGVDVSQTPMMPPR
jgi:hypothetical protein